MAPVLLPGSVSLPTAWLYPSTLLLPCLRYCPGALRLRLSVSLLLPLLRLRLSSLLGFLLLLVLSVLLRLLCPRLGLLRFLSLLLCVLL